MPQNNTLISDQRGNAFLIIMLGIALFAALSFTISRGMRSDTTSRLSQREVELAAADILDYSQKIERAIDRLRRRNTSENDLSFDQNLVAGYAHGQPDSHKIFNASGGSLTWRSPVSGANDGSDWIFTGRTCIVDLGTGGAGCDGDSNSNEELIAVLPEISELVCGVINERLNIAGIPSDTGGGYSPIQFTGTYADSTKIALAGGPFNAACYEDGGSYHFYSVLLAR